MNYPTVAVATAAGTDTYIDAAVAIGADRSLTVTDATGPHHYGPDAWTEVHTSP